MNDDGNKVENLLRTFKANFRKFLTDIKDGKQVDIVDLEGVYQLKKHWIPSVIISNYFNTHNRSFEDIVKEKMITFTEETSKLIEEFSKENPDDRDKKFKFSFKKGDLATFIARDIVLLMKPDYKDGKKIVSKLSSLEYDILQSKLAYFVKNATDLKVLFRKWELHKKHPFLHDVSMHPVKDKMGRMCEIGIKKYFKNYLYERRKWLQSYKEPYSKENYYFIDDFKASKTPAQIAEYASNLLHHSVYIPNDLFLDLLAENNHKKEDKKDNANYLISEKLAPYKE